MADNPGKKGLDAKRVSQQPHEQAYQRRKKREAQEGGRSSTGSKNSGKGHSPGRSSSGR